MTSFSFVATKKDGSTLSSTIESSDRAAAIRSIQAQGLKLVNLKEAGAKTGRKRRRKIKSDELVMFTRQLSSMVSAGVPILRSLESMTEHAESASFRSMVRHKIVIQDKAFKQKPSASLSKTLRLAHCSRVLPSTNLQSFTI